MVAWPSSAWPVHNHRVSTSTTSRWWVNGASKPGWAFVLHEVQEMGSAEICKILEVGRTNLGVMLHRVRNGLRECLAAKGFKGANECSIAGKWCESWLPTDWMIGR